MDIINSLTKMFGLQRWQVENTVKLIDEGNVVFNAGHDAHMKLLQQEASGEELPFRIILLHAEDQLMSAEGFRILAERFITVYQRMGASA